MRCHAFVINLTWPSSGVMACPADLVTLDGYDMQFGTNVIGKSSNSV